MIDDLIRYLDTLPATQDPDCTSTAGDVVRAALAEARREERMRYGGRPESIAPSAWDAMTERLANMEGERDAARAEVERLRKAAEAVLEHASWFARKTPMAGNAIVSNLPQLRAALDGE